MINTKWTIVLQAALMYLGHGFYLFCLIGTRFDELANVPFFWLLAIGTGILLLGAVFGTVGAVLSVIGLWKGIASPVKATFIVKLVLIPWYIMNVFYCVISCGILMKVAVLILFLSVCVTYAFMVLAGIPDVLYTVRALKNRRVKPSALLIVGILFQFVFVLDVVGAGLLLRVFKKTDAEPRTDASAD